MKKLILIAVVALASIGCTTNKDEYQFPKECNCDRYVDVQYFTLADGGLFGTYTTVNDCSGKKTNGSWSGIMPKKGTCK